MHTCLNKAVNRSLLRIVTVGLIVAAGTVSAKTPLEANGKLKVIGTNLCNSAGEPVQLRGVSMHGIQWFHNYYSTGRAIRDAATKWGSDFMRLTMYIYEEGYLENEHLTPADFRREIDKYIEFCEEAGIYAVIDWHVHHPGDPHFTIDSARAFFEYMSAKHKNRANVLYEICNEPSAAGLEGVVEGHYVTWPEIKTYAETIIPIIRANDPDAVVLVGTPSWSTLGISSGNDWREISNNQLSFNNVMYVFHFYAAHHDFMNQIEAAAQVIPLFNTEWASSGFQDNSANDFTKGQQWVDMMARNKISWGYWNFAPGKSIMSMFDTTTATNGPYAPDGQNVTATGRQVYTWLTTPQDVWGAISDTTNDTTTDTTGGKAFLLDDCEDGDGLNTLRGAWYTYTDGDNGGKSVVTPAPLMFTMSAGGPGSSTKAVKVVYTIEKDELPYNGFVGVGTGLGRLPTSVLDLSKATGISFYYKGDATRLRLETTDVTNSNFHGATVSASADWKKVTVLFDDLAQENWGAPTTAVNAANAQRISWQAQGPDGSGEFWIDSLVILGLDAATGGRERRMPAVHGASVPQMRRVGSGIDVSYDLPNAAPVTVELFAADGSLLQRLHCGMQSAGRQTVAFKSVTRGVVIARIRQGAWTQSVRLNIVR